MLVEMERELRRVLSTGEADGGHILRKLLRIPKRASSVSERVARGMLHLPGKGEVPDGGSARRQ